jgi:hypothetical protein
MALEKTRVSAVGMSRKALRIFGLTSVAYCRWFFP